MKQIKQSIGQSADASLSKAALGVFSHPLSRRIGMTALRFLIGFCLSHARLPGDTAPLGVSWLAAAPAGAGGVVTLLGVLIGYLTQWGSVNAVQYIAVSLLVYAASAVFRSTPLAGHAAFMPAVTALTGGFIGFVFLAISGFTAGAFLFCVTDMLLMSGMAFFYRQAFAPGLGERRFKRSVSILLLASTLIVSLSGLTFMEVLHPARICAGIFLLYSTWRGGMGSGCATGLVMGLALDLSLGYPFFSMSLGFAGLLAGIFRRMGKLTMVIVYVLGSGIAALWAGTEALRVAVLLETFAISVITMLLPLKSGMHEMVTEDEPFMHRDAGRRTQGYARRRLTGASSAFRELYETLSGAFDRDRYRNDNDIAMVYDRVADRVCRRCRMRSECWDTHNAATCHALSDASGRLLENMRAESGDFPGFFSHRCIQMNAFVQAANEELQSMLQRRQYRSRLMENRRQVCRQYAEVSRILDDVAEEVSQGVEFDEVAERRVAGFLESVGLHHAQTAVYRDNAERRHVELTCPSGEHSGTLTALATEHGFIRTLSGYAGFPLSLPEERHTPEGERLLFPEAEALEAVVGAVSHKKQGQSVSGDCGSWFKTERGKVYLILADGMGSGQEAAREAAQACTLLERFLRAGIAPEVSLEMLNSALVLRSEVDTSFVTVDLLICDLFTGGATLYKHGASASYIKRGDQVQRVNGRSLPAGARLNTADTTHITLKSGDTLLLVSDGITGQGDDKWLCDGIGAFNAEGPRDLAERVLEMSVLHHGKGDDMTALALTLS